MWRMLCVPSYADPTLSELRPTGAPMAGIRQPGAHVNYYSCRACGHIWTLRKDGSGQVTHVTPLKRTPQDGTARGPS